MAKIDRVEDLPDWFDLDKYEGSGQFRAVDWFGSLCARKEIFRAIGSLKKFEASERIMAAVKIDLEMLRDTPLNWRGGKGWIWFPENFEKDIRESPVRDLEYDHLAFKVWMDRHDSEETGDDAAVRRWDLTIAGGESPHSDLVSPIGNIEELGTAVLVDLRASDSELMSSFSAWLKEKRVHQKSKPSRRKRLYEKWARYGLLPYLDLKIWGQEVEVRIPDRVMAAAISRYDAGEANLRKTIAPLAESLMRNLSELQALASLEIAEYPD